METVAAGSYITSCHVLYEQVKYIEATAFKSVIYRSWFEITLLYQKSSPYSTIQYGLPTMTYGIDQEFGGNRRIYRKWSAYLFKITSRYKNMPGDHLNWLYLKLRKKKVLKKVYNFYGMLFFSCFASEVLSYLLLYCYLTVVISAIQTSATGALCLKSERIFLGLCDKQLDVESYSY